MLAPSCIQQFLSLAMLHTDFLLQTARQPYCISHRCMHIPSWLVGALQQWFHSVRLHSPQTGADLPCRAGPSSPPGYTWHPPTGLHPLSSQRGWPGSRTVSRWGLMSGVGGGYPGACWGGCMCQWCCGAVDCLPHCCSHCYPACIADLAIQCAHRLVAAMIQDRKNGSCFQSSSMTCRMCRQDSAGFLQRSAMHVLSFTQMLISASSLGMSDITARKQNGLLGHCFLQHHCDIVHMWYVISQVQHST